jgi:hypothetical protein
MLKGEWIRVAVSKNTKATVQFAYTGNDARGTSPDAIFAGLTGVTEVQSAGGLLYGLGNDRRALGVAVRHYQGSEPSSVGYYELDGNMKLQKKEDAENTCFYQRRFCHPQGCDFTVEESSVLVVDDKGRRWRLPKGNDAFSALTDAAALRICREVATERDLFNCHGTFYELPAENADGYAKIRPVASHQFPD